MKETLNADKEIMVMDFIENKKFQELDQVCKFVKTTDLPPSGGYVLSLPNWITCALCSGFQNRRCNQ